MRFVAVLFAVCALGLVAAGDACGLEIQVQPKVLVVASAGDNLTIHTDFAGEPDVASLMISGKAVEIDGIWLDDCGFAVVRCTREAAAAAVESFAGKWTTAEVALTLDGESDSQTINVRK